MSYNKPGYVDPSKKSTGNDQYKDNGQTKRPEDRKQFGKEQFGKGNDKTKTSGKPTGGK